jgi:hypothetical protein
MVNVIALDNVFEDIIDQSSTFMLRDDVVLARYNFCLKAMSDPMFTFNMFSKFEMLRQVVIHKGLLEPKKRESQSDSFDRFAEQISGLTVELNEAIGVITIPGK